MSKIMRLFAEIRFNPTPPVVKDRRRIRGSLLRLPNLSRISWNQEITKLSYYKHLTKQKFENIFEIQFTCRFLTGTWPVNLSYENPSSSRYLTNISRYDVHCEIITSFSSFSITSLIMSNALETYNKIIF